MIAVAVRQVTVVRATLRLMLISAAQYRINYAIWGLVSVLQSVIYMSVWRAVAEARGGSVSGYDAAAFAGYYIALMIVRDLTTSWILYDLPLRIQSGDLSPMLLRPAHPLVDLWGRIAATRLQRILLIGPIVVALAVAFDARMDVTPAALLAALIVIPFAIVTRYLVDSLVGMVAFWTVRTDGIRSLYVIALLMLSGQFVPLVLMPEAVQVIARVLPFYWTLGFPVELLIGRAEPTDAVTGVAVLASWSLALAFASRLTWRRGITRYGAVGA